MEYPIEPPDRPLRCPNCGQGYTSTTEEAYWCPVCKIAIEILDVQHDKATPGACCPVGSPHALIRLEDIFICECGTVYDDSGEEMRGVEWHERPPRWLSRLISWLFDCPWRF